MNKTILLLLISQIGFAQIIEEPLFSKEELVIHGIRGTLYTPVAAKAPVPVVIIIAGSGPTDRNGNQATSKNNSLKFVAEALSSKGTAVFCFDKRFITTLQEGKAIVKDVVFEDQIVDTRDLISYFKSQKKHSKIIIAGHSEGSLVGMIAAADGADAYISLSGAGRTIDKIIVDQVSRQAPFLRDETSKTLEKIKAGEKLANVNPYLTSLFNDKTTPFLASWMKYIPSDEIKKLHIPVLIVNGTKDLQVATAEAELLAKAKPEASLSIIPNMNHVLKTITEDSQNIASYSNPELPVNEELIRIMAAFIKSV
ncbi:MAG TPA: alpha/beta hydrolase [Flavobacterium sp.]|jgi:hypothetical protein